MNEQESEIEKEVDKKKNGSKSMNNVEKVHICVNVSSANNELSSLV